MIQNAPRPGGRFSRAHTLAIVLILVAAVLGLIAEAGLHEHDSHDESHCLVCAWVVGGAAAIADPPSMAAGPSYRMAAPADTDAAVAMFLKDHPSRAPPGSTSV